MTKNLKERFWEIDFLRGVAIILMIIFHAAFDIDYFNMSDFDIHQGSWILFGKLIFILFFLLVGISLVLSYSRTKIINKSKQNLFVKYLKRGVKIFFWGLIITLVTWMYMREGYVIFGVLHFIGISIILAYPFLKRPSWSLFLGFLIILTGLFLYNYSFDFSWLLWLGFKPHGFYTIDYFPLFPYFGIILIGIFIGNKLYKNYKRRFNLIDLSVNPIIKFFAFLGKKSLFIYLIHQPIIIALLIIFKYI
jgi:uncharacterized membrane protein